MPLNCQNCPEDTNSHYVNVDDEFSGIGHFLSPEGRIEQMGKEGRIYDGQLRLAAKAACGGFGSCSIVVRGRRWG